MDFGCGDGNFSKALAAHPACQGVVAVDFHDDPPPGLVGDGLEYRSVESVYEGEASSHFDLIICRHIVEHVANPAEFIQQMAGRLQEGGSIFVEVPNYQSIWRRVFGADWSILYVPRHLYWFTRGNLRQFFAGLEVIEIGASETPTIGGSLNLRFGWPITNTGIFGVALYPLQWFFEKLAGESATLIVVARKPAQAKTGAQQ